MKSFRVGRWLLAFGMVVGLRAQEGELAPVLAAFPNNGLPTLLHQLVASDRLPHAALRELGADAHEALLGAALHPHLRYSKQFANMASAFGQFDAGAAWTLPLLSHPDVVQRNLVARALLLRLGPAAAAVVGELDALSKGEGNLRRFVDELTQATDGPLPDVTAREVRVVDPALRPALLDRLRVGPEHQRWPALQALLCLGDEAVTDAFVVLLELSLDPSAEQQAEELRTALQLTFSCRCLPGRQPLQHLPAADVPREARRLALAGRIETAGLVRMWRKSSNPHLRRTAALALLRLRPPHSFGLLGPLVRDPDEDSDVRRTVAAIVAVARRDGARAACSALAELQQEDPTKVRSALRSLSGHDLRDAPEVFWACIFELASHDTRSARQSRRLTPLERMELERRQRIAHDARSILLRIARAGDPVPAEFARLLPGWFVRSRDEQTLRELFAKIDLDVLEDQLKADSDRAESLAPWVTMLGGIRWGERRDAFLERVGDLIAEEIERLPTSAQLDWIKNRGPLPESVWLALFRSDDLAVRRRAAMTGWRFSFQGPSQVPIEPLIELLADPDAEVARYAAHGLGYRPVERDRAVTALLARYDTAEPELRAQLAFALWAQREVAGPVRKAIEQILVQGTDKEQTHAAMTLLFLEPAHPTAFARLNEMLADPDHRVRQYALYQTAHDKAIARRLLDVAIGKLDDPDDDVRYAAARFFEALPEARDRTLPALRAYLDSAQRDTQSYKRAITAIERIEKATADPAAHKR